MGRSKYVFAAIASMIAAASAPESRASSLAPDSGYLFNDAHFHLTNYVQEGLTIRAYLAIMGNKVG
ncbi:MAG TPA: hypothetical protein VF835_06240, partial [Rhizomicrobium sp.]